MALYTVEECINKCKLLIEEAADTNVVTENQLINATSDAQKWVATEARCYQAWDTSTITLTINTVDYSPPSDTSGILGVRYDFGTNIGYRDLKRVTPENIPPPPDFSFPYFWHYRGNVLSIYPELASVSGISTVIEILIAKIPADLTALSDSLTIPDEFQLVVPYLVAKTVAIKDNQREKIAILSEEIQRLMKVGEAEYSHKGGLPSHGGAV